MNKKIGLNLVVLFFAGVSLIAASKMDSIDKLLKEYRAKKKYEKKQLKKQLRSNRSTLKRKLESLNVIYKRKHQLDKVKKINKLLKKIKQGKLDAFLDSNGGNEKKRATFPTFPEELAPKPVVNSKKLPRIKTKRDFLLLLKKYNPSFFGSYDIRTEKGNITGLHLAHCGIVDITPIATLKNLKWLNLTGNPVSDLTPLKRLRKLESLNLDQTFVSDLSPIKNLPLRSLSLAKCPVSDISPVNRKVSYLSLQNAFFIKSLAPIAKMKNLNELILPPHFALFHVTFIKRLRQLKFLDTRWRKPEEKVPTQKFLRDHAEEIE